MRKLTLWCMAGLILMGSFFVSAQPRVGNFSSQIPTTSATLAPRGFLASPESQEQYAARCIAVSHLALNAYVWDAVNALRNEGKYTEYRIELSPGRFGVIVPLPRLLIETGVVAHSGIGNAREDHLPVIYIDSAVYNDTRVLSNQMTVVATVLQHEKDELVRYEDLRILLSNVYRVDFGPEKMRLWLQEYYDVADARLEGTEFSGKTSGDIAKGFHAASISLDGVYELYKQEIAVRESYLHDLITLYAQTHNYQELPASGDVYANTTRRRDVVIAAGLVVAVPLQAEARKAMADENVASLQEHIAGLLGKSSNKKEKFYTFLNECEIAALQDPAAPTESRYPILKAINLLSRDKHQQIIAMIKADERFKKMMLAAKICVMLGESMSNDWLLQWAPALAHRTVWQVASEIWYPIGGLGRVKQYEAPFITEILKQGDGKLCQIEPHYLYGMDGKDLNYGALPIPIEGQKQVMEFDIVVFNAPVTVVVTKGVNRYGVECYLIRDKANWFTRKPYDYGDGRSKVSWMQFASFLSKASNELIRRVSAEERAQDQEWRPPVVEYNDGQLGFASFLLAKHDLNNPQSPLHGAVDAFVTHTIFNRGFYEMDTIETLAREMGCSPEEVRSYFHHLDKRPKPQYDWQRGDTLDTSSAGLRSADVALCVAQQQRNIVKHWDDWRERFVLYAVANGDDRSFSARFFRVIMRRLFPGRFSENDNLAIEYPQSQEVYDTKRKAKEEAVFTSSNGSEVRLDPDKYTIGYSGRLVNEKAGLLTAFTEENIRAYVAAGHNVIIYGRIVNEESARLAELLHGWQVRIENEFKEPHHGKFIYRSEFTIEDQQKLFALLDVHANPSDRDSEAAGVTETDAMSCGALILAPPYREGLLQAHGVPFKAGWGNVITPEDDSPAAYQKAVLEAFSLDKNIFAKNQVMSIQLSRVLAAALTVMDRLHLYGIAAAKKDARLSGKNMTIPANTLKTIYETYAARDFAVSQLYDIREDVPNETIDGEINILVELGILAVVERGNGNRILKVSLCKEFALVPESVSRKAIDVLCAMHALSNPEGWMLSRNDVEGWLKADVRAIIDKLPEDARQSMEAEVDAELFETLCFLDRIPDEVQDDESFIVRANIIRIKSEFSAGMADMIERMIKAYVILLKIRFGDREGSKIKYQPSGLHDDALVSVERLRGQTRISQGSVGVDTAKFKLADQELDVQGMLNMAMASALMAPGDSVSDSDRQFIYIIRNIYGKIYGKDSLASLPSDKSIRDRIRKLAPVLPYNTEGLRAYYEYNYKKLEEAA